MRGALVGAESLDGQLKNKFVLDTLGATVG